MTAKMYNKMESTHTAPEDMDKYVREEWNGQDLKDLIRIEEPKDEEKAESDKEK